jgi:hypothetical protein
MPRRSFIAIFSTIFVAIIASSAVADDTAPTSLPAPRLEDSYQLGLAAYAPSAAIVSLDETIKNRHSDIGNLAVLAAKTRIAELTGYKSAVAVLNRMGAPEVVVKPYADAVVDLSAPLTITDHAKAQTPTDGVAQTILSTIDEAGAITPDETAVLAPWLKLSHGRDGLWAYRIGCLIAVIRADIPCKPSDLPLIDGAIALAGSSPNGTPESLSDALLTLGEQDQLRQVKHTAIQAVDAAAAAVFEAPANDSGPTDAD